MHNCIGIFDYVARQNSPIGEMLAELIILLGYTRNKMHGSYHKIEKAKCCSIKD